MDNLHATLASLRPETKSTPDHLTIFREFLAQLDELQRQSPPKQPRVKLPARRKPARRGRGS
jgi:nitrate reductase assembly molybdenum cofactor insertion protein NarJ